MSDKTHSGSCLCGGVKFEISAPTTGIYYCHCIQCRKQTGHHSAAIEWPVANLKLLKDGTLKWYRASEIAKRGFCDTCGSSLFWRSDRDSDRVFIHCGVFDGDVELPATAHIFTDWKGDYYELSTDVPHYRESD